MQICALECKRLPSSAEWYALSGGMAGGEPNCNFYTKSFTPTGSMSLCITPHGAYDLEGKVWEWGRDNVIDGVDKTKKLPSSVYGAKVDSTGMATVRST